MLVAAGPLVLAPSPGAGGPITGGVRLLQLLAVMLGFVIAATGHKSYQTGDIRPSAAIGLSALGTTLVGAIGALVERVDGSLVLAWVWVLASVPVVGAAIKVAYGAERFDPS